MLNALTHVGLIAWFDRFDRVFARRAFSVAVPSVWNSLPEYLRDPANSQQQRQFQETDKDVSVCNVLMHTAR